MQAGFSGVLAAIPVTQLVFRSAIPEVSKNGSTAHQFIDIAVGEPRFEASEDEVMFFLL